MTIWLALKRDKGMTVPVQIERGGEKKILIVTF